VVSLGAVSYWTGLGLAALGRLDEARADLCDAQTKNALRGSTRWARAAAEALAGLGHEVGKEPASRP
jgi:hypothetical protein